MSSTKRGGQRSEAESRLTLLRREGAYGIYRCLCGNEARVRADHVSSGATLSCGCLIRELCRERSTVHGHDRRGLRTPEYTSWVSMIARCSNPRNKLWPYYGERGIKVHPSWLGSAGFEQFLKDMGPRPSQAYSLDRYPNNDGDYKPGNVRWATDTQQARNRRSNRLIWYREREMPLAEAAELSGIPYKTVHCRINNHGWSIDRALSEPVRGAQ